MFVNVGLLSTNRVLYKVHETSRARPQLWAMIETSSLPLTTTCAGRMSLPPSVKPLRYSSTTL